jgi:hypothetical protein
MPSRIDDLLEHIAALKRALESIAEANLIIDVCVMPSR